MYYIMFSYISKLVRKYLKKVLLNFIFLLLINLSVYFFLIRHISKLNMTLTHSTKLFIFENNILKDFINSFKSTFYYLRDIILHIKIKTLIKLYLLFFFIFYLITIIEGLFMFTGCIWSYPYCNSKISVVHSWF